jgi:hypothetical protein
LRALKKATDYRDFLELEEFFVEVGILLPEVFVSSFELLLDVLLPFPEFFTVILPPWLYLLTKDIAFSMPIRIHAQTIKNLPKSIDLEAKWNTK